MFSSSFFEDDEDALLVCAESFVDSKGMLALEDGRVMASRAERGRSEGMVGYFTVDAAEDKKRKRKRKGKERGG